MDDHDAATVARVHSLASVLTGIPVSDESSLGVRGLIVGAAYSLARALELGYQDLTGRKRQLDYGDTLVAASHALSAGQTPDRGPWLANYYYNNALIRLAVAGERLEKHKPPRRDRKPTIREEVNIFKHEFGGLLSRGRSVQPGQALDELASLVNRLETREAANARRRRTRS